MNESNLVLMPAHLLYAGMKIPHDIYNSTGKILLLTKGNVINLHQLEIIKRQSENGLILVSVETEKLMRLQGIPNKTVIASSTLEDNTGYTEVKYEALEILEKISNTGKLSINKKELSSVSDELSQTVEKTEPSVIIDLVSSLAPVDEYLQRHCINVSLLNGLIGKWIGLSKEMVDTLILIGLLHDCGKASIPNKILNSPKALTTIEFEVIKTHTMFSYDLLEEFPENISKAARGHHEKMNGTGYPDGLAGSKIPFMSRVTAVSDIYDAMTARRSYKTPKSPFAILSMLGELKGKDLDEKIVDIFIEKMPQELVGKPVLLSNGLIGLVQESNSENIEYPSVRIGQKIIQTNKDLNCISMYFEDTQYVGINTINKE